MQRINFINFFLSAAFDMKKFNIVNLYRGMMEIRSAGILGLADWDQISYQWQESKNKINPSSGFNFQMFHCSSIPLFHWTFSTFLRGGPNPAIGGVSGLGFFTWDSAVCLDCPTSSRHL
jgi:hypothetical protein